MSEVNDGKGYITRESAKGLSQMLKWYRGLLRTDEGASDDPPISEIVGLGFIGVAQQQILPGSYGPVNIWSGPKGQEADTGITIQAFTRFNVVTAGQTVIFYAVDRGFEIYSPPPMTNPTVQGPCPCLICQTTATTTTCSELDPASNAWSFSDWNGPNVVTHGGGCTWNQPAVASGQNYWTLNIASGSAVMTYNTTPPIKYVADLDEFTGVCQNTMNLWLPNGIPVTSTSGQLGLASGTPIPVACNLCLSPIPRIECGNCGEAPQTVNLTLSNFVSPLDQFNGTWEVPLTSDTTSGSITACVWSMPVGTATIVINGQTVNRWSLKVLRGYADGVYIYVELVDAGLPTQPAAAWTNVTCSLPNGFGNCYFPPSPPCCGDYTIGNQSVGIGYTVTTGYQGAGGANENMPPLTVTFNC
jgi:hypothetical protein